VAHARDFSWDSTAERLVEVYSEVMREHRIRRDRELCRTAW
jgi:glycogen synthase